METTNEELSELESKLSVLHANHQKLTEENDLIKSKNRKLKEEKMNEENVSYIYIGCVTCILINFYGFTGCEFNGSLFLAITIFTRFCAHWLPHKDWKNGSHIKLTLPSFKNVHSM